MLTHIYATIGLPISHSMKPRNVQAQVSDSSSPFHLILELVTHVVTLFKELRCVCISCDHIMNVLLISKAQVHCSVSSRLRKLQYNSEYRINNELDFVVGRSRI